LTTVRANGREKTGDLTPAELREVERGFALMLRRKFSAAWIAENASALVAQAVIEYAEWLEENPPARNPVGWLLTCAYRRAQNLLDSQTRRPPMASLDAVFHLADESTPTPEQEALDHDRGERLREAMRHLPPKERKLLALVYFEHHSIREAGRKVGWQKSAADRHHDWALEKLHALVGERSLLSPATVGLAAWVLAKGEGQDVVSVALDWVLAPCRRGVAIGAEVLTSGAHRGAELWRRIAPFADPSAGAASGSGRVVGACGAALATAVCGLAITGAVPWVGGKVTAAPHPANAPQHSITRQVSKVWPAQTTPQPPAQDSPPRRHSNLKRSEPARAKTAYRAARRTLRTPPTEAPVATTKQTINEFGVEAGSVREAAPAPTPASSGLSGSSASSPGSSGRSSGSSGSSVASEFGM
jgi:RNA polymerase sigma factor (sigma-70 family)